MLKIKANPTFKAKANIGVPGGEPVALEFTFRHRTRSELLQWIEDSKDKTDLDYVMSCVTSWELTDEFTRENVGLLLENYLKAAAAIASTYLKEIGLEREKN